MVKEGDKVEYRNPMEKIHYEGRITQKKGERVKISVNEIYSGKEVDVAFVKNDERLEKIKEN